MFFVGATGQLLTLILTVGLPFVFLFSGYQKIELTQNNPTIEVFQEASFNIQSEKVSYAFEFDAYFESSKQHCLLDFSPPDKISFAFSYSDWESRYLTSSGNKAPPVFI